MPRSFGVAVGLSLFSHDHISAVECMISFELGKLVLDVLKSEAPGAEFRRVYRSLDISSVLDGIGKGRVAGDSYIESQS